MRETTVASLYPASQSNQGLAFRVGWKCLDGGSLTFDTGGEPFATLEAAKAHAKTAAFDEGLGRRVFLADEQGGIYRTWRVRLGPDYKPHGHPTGWGLY